MSRLIPAVRTFSDSNNKKYFILQKKKIKLNKKFMKYAKSQSFYKTTLVWILPLWIHIFFICMEKTMYETDEQDD